MTIIKANDIYGNYFIDLVKDRIYKTNQNCLICFVGQTGSGKSYSSITLALELDNNFSIDKIYFEIDKFIQDLSDNIFKKGDVIIIDDAGVSISNRDWQSVINRAIGIIVQSFRFLNLVLIINVPKISFIELQVRSLLHYYLIHNKGQGNFKLQVSKENMDISNDTEIIASSLDLDDDSILSEIQFLMPYDMDLINEYEKRKSDFMNNVYKKLYQEIKTGKGNISVKCMYCKTENYVKSDAKAFKCHSCGFRNKISG